MARVKIPIVLIDKDTGNAQPGVSVAIKKRADGSPANVYLSETTPTAESSNVLSTQIDGSIAAWVDAGIPYVGTIVSTSTDIPFEGAASTPAPIAQYIRWSLGGVILVPTNNTTDIGVAPGAYVEGAPGETMWLTKIRYKTHSGAVTFKVQVNGADVTTWGTSGTLSAGTGGGVQTLSTPIQVNAGDYIQLIVLTNPSSAGIGLAATATVFSYAGS